MKITENVKFIIIQKPDESSYIRPKTPKSRGHMENGISGFKGTDGNSIRSLRPRNDKNTNGAGRVNKRENIVKEEDIEEGEDDPQWTKAWNGDEDTMLIKLCKSKLKNKWTSIAKIISTKSPSQCIYRYSKLKRTKKDMFVRRKGEVDILFSERVKNVLSDRGRLRFIQKPENNIGLLINENKKENKKSKSIEKPKPIEEDPSMSGFINTRGASREFKTMRRPSGVSKFDHCDEGSILGAFQKPETRLDDPTGKFIGLKIDHSQFDQQNRGNSFETYIKRAYLNIPNDYNDNIMTSGFRKYSGSKEFTKSFKEIFNTNSFSNTNSELKNDNQTSSFYLLDSRISLHDVNKLLKDINSTLTLASCDDGLYKKLVNYLNQVSMFVGKIKDNKLASSLLQTQASLVERMIQFIKQKIKK
jgi:hypothetical protein